MGANNKNYGFGSRGSGIQTGVRLDGFRFGAESPFNAV